MMKAPDIISDMKEHNKQVLLESTKKIRASSSLALPTLDNSNSSSLPVQLNKNNAKPTSSKPEFEKYLCENKISVLKCNNQIKELHTLLRDRLF